MSFEPYNWQCPVCGNQQVVTEHSEGIAEGAIGTSRSRHADVGYQVRSIACANPECKELTVDYYLFEKDWNQATGSFQFKQMIRTGRILPDAAGKPQPDYIPDALRQDYQEACRIAFQSPKASATLSRRCLQGIIRDFCEIALGTLDAEIKELQKRIAQGSAPTGVSSESVEAIDHARKIGNIGAHMEKDVNLIIEVEATEASILLELIELLFREWYVSRHNRQVRLADLKAAADRITAAKAGKQATS